MAFVDEITIHMKAGDGGDGVVRWLHEKYKEYSGPCGGDGGRGGAVFIHGVRDIALLERYRYVKELVAEEGGDGEGNRRHGKSGDDLIVDVPIGSRVINLHTEEAFEIEKEGDKIQILSGGSGGYGNERFKGPENQQPMQSTLGKQGEEADFYIEMRLIADIGLVGLPNAGKSSLLNSLTAAKAKVGSYQFTTLEPNLGVLHGVVIADIPGLIEGASEGKGLGHKFLRHVERTKVLAHCVSLESKDPMADYKTVRAELDTYGKGMTAKEEIIVLTKTDCSDEKTIEKTKKLFEKLKKEVVTVSVLDDESVKKISEFLVRKVKGVV